MADISLYLGSVILEGHGRPNVFLAGQVGQKYKDLDTNIEYVCRGERGFIRVDGDDQSEMYNWDMIESGGGGQYEETLKGMLMKTIEFDAVIPEGVTTVSSFTDCTGLKSITMPDSVKTITNSAFYNCVNLTDIILPNGLTTIERGAFSKCSGLTSIIIPDSVKTMESNIFSQCTSLTDVTLPNGLELMDDGLFFLCANLTNVVIPDSVNTIGGQAFYNCTSLTNITFPEGVTFIAQNAFMGCTSMQEYHFKGTTPPRTSGNPFPDLPSACKLYVPQGSLEAYRTSEYWMALSDDVFVEEPTE